MLGAVVRQEGQAWLVKLWIRVAWNVQGTPETDVHFSQVHFNTPAKLGGW